MSRFSRSIPAVVAAATLLFAGTGTAMAAESLQPGEVASWTGMGPQLPEKDNLSSAAIASLQADNPSPLGVNEACDSGNGNPVVLIHGMNSNAYGSYAKIGPHLKAAGKCVFALNFGAYDGADDAEGSSAMGSLPGFGGLASLDHSLAEITAQIKTIKENTGSQKVDLVGYSEGATLATAYAKQTGGADVGTVVSIAGVLRGTSMLGLSNLHVALTEAGVPVAPAVDKLLGPVGTDLLEDSDFITRLRDGGIEVPGVHYVAISSTLDEAANSLNNTQYQSGDYQNYVVQEGCPSDTADHLGMPYDNRAIGYMDKGLGIDSVVPCTSTHAMFPEGSSL